jgi:L-iditol 2-dehydrogenase
VLASDPLDGRRRTARSLGVEAVLEADDSLPERVRAATGGRGADCVLVAAPGRAAFSQAVTAARPAGRILVFAATAPGETAELDLGALCAAEKEVLTSYSASIDVQDEAARLVFDRQVRVRELISHRFPIERAAQAFSLAARAAPGTLKVILRMGATEA